MYEEHLAFGSERRRKKVESKQITWSFKLKRSEKMKKNSNADEWNEIQWDSWKPNKSFFGFFLGRMCWLKGIIFHCKQSYEWGTKWETNETEKKTNEWNRKTFVQPHSFNCPSAYLYVNANHSIGNFTKRHSLVLVITDRYLFISFHIFPSQHGEKKLNSNNNNNTQEKCCSLL